MKEEVLSLVHALCRPGEDDGALEVFCQAACSRLDSLLAEGVTAEDCWDLYLPAAAWLTMDMLRDSRNWEGVTSLSAGDMTVHTERTGGLEERAMAVMAPYLKDRSFVFQGVKG